MSTFTQLLLRYFWSLEYFYLNTLYSFGISGTLSTFTQMLFIFFKYFWFLEYFYSNTLYFLAISGTWSTFTQLPFTLFVFLVLWVLLLKYFRLSRYFWYFEYFYSNTFDSLGISGIQSTFTFSTIFFGSRSRVFSEPTQFLQELLF